jgi:hypothetical protein
MQLSTDQAKVFMDWLNAKWKAPRTCPICGDNNWNASDRIFEMREFQGGAMVIGGLLQPVVPVSCVNCSHTLYFNAIQIGIVDSHPKDGVK